MKALESQSVFIRYNSYVGDFYLFYHEVAVREIAMVPLLVTHW